MVIPGASSHWLPWQRSNYAEDFGRTLSCALIATLRVLRDRHAEGTTMARQSRGWTSPWTPAATGSGREGRLSSCDRPRGPRSLDTARPFGGGARRLGLHRKGLAPARPHASVHLRTMRGPPMIRLLGGWSLHNSLINTSWGPRTHLPKPDMWV